MDARVARARVMRVVRIFTLGSPQLHETLGGRQPGGLVDRIGDLEVPGFASPPHDGFALDGLVSERR